MTDQELLAELNLVGKELKQLIHAIVDALRDDPMTSRNEAKISVSEGFDIAKEGYDFVRALMDLFVTFEGDVRDFDTIIDRLHLCLDEPVAVAHDPLGTPSGTPSSPPSGIPQPPAPEA
jgi:hypothetical protein